MKFKTGIIIYNNVSYYEIYKNYITQKFYFFQKKDWFKAINKNYRYDKFILYFDENNKYKSFDPYIKRIRCKYIIKIDLTDIKENNKELKEINILEESKKLGL